MEHPACVHAENIWKKAIANRQYDHIHLPVKFSNFGLDKTQNVELPLKSLNEPTTLLKIFASDFNDYVTWISSPPITSYDSNLRSMRVLDLEQYSIDPNSSFVIPLRPIIKFPELDNIQIPEVDPNIFNFNIEDLVAKVPLFKRSLMSILGITIADWGNYRIAREILKI